jgi:hypothetical protein
MSSTSAVLPVRSAARQGPVMPVTFTRGDDGRHCVAVAAPAGRRPFRLSVQPLGRDLPHDIATAVVESAYACAEGFFNLTAHGATFRSGDRRRTGPGRGLIREHAAGLTLAEHLVHDAVNGWREGRGGLAVPLLDTALESWDALRVGADLTLEWVVLPLPRVRRG